MLIHWLFMEGRGLWTGLLAKSRIPLVREKGNKGTDCDGRA
jgi:hypothetical protein